MNHIHNVSFCQPKLLNKTVAGFTCLLTISAIALFLIGLIAPQSSPFSVITQLGSGNNAIFLGTSIFLFILDLVWIGAIKKNINKNFENRSNDVSQQNADLESARPLDLFPCPLPEPLIRLFLSYLDPFYLEQVAQAKGWEEIASSQVLWNNFNLQQLFPKLTIFGEELWETGSFAPLKLSARDIKPIDGNDKRAMIPIIQKLLPLVEEDMGVTILTIPKGLTFNHLVTFAESLAEKYGTIFRYLWQDFRNKYGNVSIPETYRVILTNNVLKDTRNKSVQAQKDLIDKLGIGCDFPEVIEMVTLLISTLLNSNNRLFNDNPWTYSRCREIIDGWHTCVGAFLAGSGFGVSSNRFGNGSGGLAGRREFMAIGN